MKIFSFILGILIAYFIINSLYKEKFHGFNSNKIKNQILKSINNKYRLIPITYTCLYC